jgi:hypothetical protein
MKTAVQQVFSELEELHPNLFNINTTEGKEFVHHFHKYIALEKEQIIKAHTNGWNKGIQNELITSQEYYKQTYESNT